MGLGIVVGLDGMRSRSSFAGDGQSAVNGVDGRVRPDHAEVGW